MVSSGNGVAYFVMALWPLLAIYWYTSKSIQVATLWTIIGGFLFLPVLTEVDLPFIPPLGKLSIPVLSVLMGCSFIAKKRIGIFDNKGILKLLVILLLISPLLTVISNTESIEIAGRYLPGLTAHDTLSMAINQLLFVMPFFIGRRFFRTYDDQLLLFKTLVIVGVFYTLFILFEVRMSPVLHTWLYGYFPHDYIQQKRFGGFRPVVFIGHGLNVAFFINIVLISSLALLINKIRVTALSPKLTTGYLFMILLICKSAASFIYGIFSLLVLRFLSVKNVVRIAIMIAMLSILYPILSISNLFPHKKIVEIVDIVNHDRANSLAFRFKNENMLLDHAQDKSYFGWGGWGRNLVYNESGRDISVTDGNWIIQFGQFGWTGFIALYGLMFVTVFSVNKNIQLLQDKRERNLLAAHSLIVAIIMIDQLPNSSLAPWLWLIIGALLGRCEMIGSETKITTTKFQMNNNINHG